MRMLAPNTKLTLCEYTKGAPAVVGYEGLNVDVRFGFGNCTLSLNDTAVTVDDVCSACTLYHTSESHPPVGLSG